MIKLSKIRQKIQKFFTRKSYSPETINKLVELYELSVELRKQTEQQFNLLQQRIIELEQETTELRKRIKEEQANFIEFTYLSEKWRKTQLNFELAKQKRTVVLRTKAFNEYSGSNAKK